MAASQDTVLFQRWLAGHWQTDSDAVAEILADPLAVQFLIAWSIFESRFFVGRGSFSAKIEAFAKSYPAGDRDEKLSQAAEHFHQRYKDRRLYDNLMHTQPCNKLESLIYQKKYNALSDEESIFLLVWVIYRYRNNIFHGNKRVRSWLNYQEQIGFCVSAMQIIIDAQPHV